jgi:hypothetical protein
MVIAKRRFSMEAPRNPAVAEVLTTWRTRLVGVVDGIPTQASKEHGPQRAEALVASFDGSSSRPSRSRQTSGASSWPGRCR